MSAVAGSPFAIDTTSTSNWLQVMTYGGPYNTTDGGYFLLWAEVNALPDAVSPSRTTTIQVNNETYIVTQDGIDNTYHFNPPTVTLPATGGYASVTVTSAVVGPVSVAITSGGNWLTEFYDSPQTGYPMGLYAPANVATDELTQPRTATIQNNEVYVVTQEGTAPPDKSHPAVQGPWLSLLSNVRR